ncbi:MAG: hypothetical protein ACOCRK_11100 [bacterium]
MIKLKRFLCVITIFVLIFSLFPTVTFANSHRETYERVLDDSEMKMIVGGCSGGGSGGGSDDNDDPTYSYDKGQDYSVSYGTASLKFFRVNRTSEPIYVGRKTIDSWTITGSFSGSATVKSVFNVGAKFEGSKSHTEETGTSFKIPANYCYKIYTKPFTEITDYTYKKYKHYNGHKTLVWTKTGTYKYTDKKVTHTGYSLK